MSRPAAGGFPRKSRRGESPDATQGEETAPHQELKGQRGNVERPVQGSRFSKKHRLLNEEAEAVRIREVASITPPATRFPPWREDFLQE